MYATYAEFVTEKFVKRLQGKGKDEIEATLERLDRLTKDEGLSVVAQTLGEVNKIKRLWFLSASLSLPRPTEFCR
jgi:hypothetical protein